MMQKTKWFIFYVGFVFIMADCTPNVAPATGSSDTAAPVEPVTTGSVTVSTEEAILTWQGYTEIVNGDTTKCKVLTIEAGNVVRHGFCENDKSMTVVEDYLPLHGSEIQARFAPFILKSEQETVTFQGSGNIEGEVWQCAIATNAETGFSEAVTGRLVAAVRTATRRRRGNCQGRELVRDQRNGNSG
jgi:hypothetical protein